MREDEGKNERIWRFSGYTSKNKKKFKKKYIRKHDDVYTCPPPHDRNHFCINPSAIQQTTTAPAVTSRTSYYRYRHQMQETPTDTNYRHAVGVTPLPGNRLTSPCERNNSISRKCCLDCCSAFQCIAVCQSDHYESGGGRRRREVTVRKPTNADWFLFMRTKELFVREGSKKCIYSLDRCTRGEGCMCNLS